MIRFLRNLLPLLLLSLIWGCASLPESSVNKPAHTPLRFIDHSQPTMASMYYFTCGSYLSALNEHGVAGQVYAMALDSDPQSPYIRKAYFISSAKFYRANNAPESRLLLQDLLRQARKDYQFDKEMLQDAFDSYYYLDDPEGMKWANDQLLIHAPDARAYYNQFLMEEKTSGKPNLKHLQTAESLLDGDEELARLIALAWFGRDDSRAASILQSLTPGLLNESLLQSLYLNGNNAANATARFAKLRYPEDKDAMAGYLYFYYDNRRYERILEQTESILATRDSGLLYLNASAALKTLDQNAFNKLLNYLNSPPEDSAGDSRLAALMMMQAIKQGNTAAINKLSGYIRESGDLNLALFSVVLDSSMPDTEVESIKTELARDISQYVPTGLLKDYLLLITEGNPADRAHPAFVAYSKELWDNGLGGELDLGVLLNHYTQTGDGKSQIKYLRMAVSRWPENPQWQNNLGYLLLSDSANWDEAEALISAALKLEPESLHFQDSMARLHYLRGDYDLAAKYLPALEGSSEESSELLYHIGMIHLKLKNITKAEDFLTRALKAANPEDYADLARKQLELMHKEP